MYGCSNVPTFLGYIGFSVTFLFWVDAPRCLLIRSSFLPSRGRYTLKNLEHWNKPRKCLIYMAKTCSKYLGQIGTKSAKLEQRAGS